jgi:hypothetical protein
VALPMNKYDFGSGLFWLSFSIFVLLESIHLGTGSLHNPGMGLMAFGASGLLGILSLALLVQTVCKRESPKTQPIFAGTLWKRVVLILFALLIYSQLMPIGGYLVTTFLLMTFLFGIVERQKIGWVFLLSILTTLTTYLVFSKWLNCQFPDGLLGL